MPGELVPIIIIPALFWMIAYMTRTISDNFMRKHLLNKEVSADVIDKIFLQSREGDISANLKWGMVSIALGLSFAVIAMLGLSGTEPMTYAVFFLFAGAGLIGFYALRSKGSDA